MAHQCCVAWCLRGETAHTDVEALSSGWIWEIRFYRPYTVSADAIGIGTALSNARDHRRSRYGRLLDVPTTVQHNNNVAYHLCAVITAAISPTNEVCESDTQDPRNY